MTECDVDIARICTSLRLSGGTTIFQGIGEHMNHRRCWLHLRKHQDCDTVLKSNVEIDWEKTFVLPDGDNNTVEPNVSVSRKRCSSRSSPVKEPAESTAFLCDVEICKVSVRQCRVVKWHGLVPSDRCAHDEELTALALFTKKIMVVALGMDRGCTLSSLCTFQFSQRLYFRDCLLSDVSKKKKMIVGTLMVISNYQVHEPSNTTPPQGCTAQEVRRSV